MLTAVRQGFRLFFRVLSLVLNGLFRAFSMTPWAALTFAFCVVATYLICSWVFAFLGSIAVCIISFLGSLASRISPQTSTTPGTAFATGTPAVSPLSTGVTACGQFLATQVTALASVSASAPGAALVASEVFSNLGTRSLEGQKVVQQDWSGIALNASKQSSAIIDQFYAELQHADSVLARVGLVTENVANKTHGMELADKDGGKPQQSHLSQLLAAVFRSSGSSELAEHKRVCQRMLGDLSQVRKQSELAHTHFRAEISIFTTAQRKHLKVVPDQPGNEEIPDEAKGPGVFFRKAIEHLNAVFDSTDTSIGSNPDQAAFVRHLYAAQGAGSVFNGAFTNVIHRLDELSKKMGEERAWVKVKVEWRLGDLNSRLSLRRAETPFEVELDAKGISSLAKDWRSKLQELYYQ